jgi:cold shock CspA family protein/ribosome-associated translation inhibitor RaiA
MEVHMQVPLEIACKGLDRTDKLQSVIDKNAERLEKVCDHIISCRMVIERPHEHPDQGSDYRVSLVVRIPPNHEVVIKHSSTEGDMHESLEKIINDVFHAASRQCQEIARLQRDRVKRHPERETAAIVIRIFPEQNYGFLQALDGREIYFHRNSILNDDFERITVGTGVRYIEEPGEEGPQATTVAIVGKPGAYRSEPERFELRSRR